LFELIVTEKFARSLKKLEKNERERIKEKLLISSKDPFHTFERLHGFPLFKLRIGKYRVISKILTMKKEIILLSVSHRKKAYKKI